jgi:hypothetical protein
MSEEQITFQYSMPAAKFPKMLAAFCGAYGYQAQVEEREFDEQGNETSVKMVDNPVSPPAFALSCVEKFINEVIDGWDASETRRIAEEERAKKKAEEGDSGVAITVLG